MHNGVVVKSTTTNVGDKQARERAKRKADKQGQAVPCFRILGSYATVVVNTNSFAGGKR